MIIIFWHTEAQIYPFLMHSQSLTGDLSTVGCILNCTAVSDENPLLFFICFFYIRAVFVVTQMPFLFLIFMLHSWHFSENLRISYGNLQLPTKSNQFLYAANFQFSLIHSMRYCTWTSNCQNKIAWLIYWHFIITTLIELDNDTRSFIPLILFLLLYYTSSSISHCSQWRPLPLSSNQNNKFYLSFPFIEQTNFSTSNPTRGTLTGQWPRKRQG